MRVGAGCYEMSTSLWAAHPPNTKIKPTMKFAAYALITLTTLTSVSCAGRPSVPSLTQTYNGKPVLTRSSHPAGGSMEKVDGVYLGRRYFYPQGTKSGIAWTDVYGQR